MLTFMFHLLTRTVLGCCIYVASSSSYNTSFVECHCQNSQSKRFSTSPYVIYFFDYFWDVDQENLDLFRCFIWLFDVQLTIELATLSSGHSIIPLVMRLTIWFENQPLICVPLSICKCCICYVKVFLYLFGNMLLSCNYFLLLSFSSLSGILLLV